MDSLNRLRSFIPDERLPGIRLDRHPHASRPQASKAGERAAAPSGSPLARPPPTKRMSNVFEMRPWRPTVSGSRAVGSGTCAAGWPEGTDNFLADRDKCIPISRNKVDSNPNLRS